MHSNQGLHLYKSNFLSLGSALVGAETPLQQEAHSFSSECAKSALSNKVCISLNSRGLRDVFALHILYSFLVLVKMQKKGGRRKRKA